MGAAHKIFLSFRSDDSLEMLAILAEGDGETGMKRFRQGVEGKPAELRHLVRLVVLDLVPINQNEERDGDPR
jgi:hypothetical protein